MRNFTITEPKHNELGRLLTNSSSKQRNLVLFGMAQAVDNVDITLFLQEGYGKLTDHRQIEAFVYRWNEYLPLPIAELVRMIEKVRLSKSTPTVPQPAKTILGMYGLQGLFGNDLIVSFDSSEINRDYFYKAFGLTTTIINDCKDQTNE